MFRHRAWRHFLRIGASGVLLLSLVGLLISGAAALAVLTTGVFLLLYFGYFTHQRYRQIGDLNDYLSQIKPGEQSLDIRDNDEGELSILKNELYKVTVSFHEQSSVLRHDKKALSDTLSDISHQLKTPLASMRLMMDILRDDDLSEEDRLEFTSRMEGQIDRLQWLVASLLTISRLDAGTIQFKTQAVAAVDLIERATAPLLIPMELKNMDLVVDAKGSSLECDAHWTAEAISNVVKNCVEHVPEGGCIAITCDDNALFFEMQIHDDGPGFADTDLPHVFTRFFRGEHTGENSVGIGLAIVKAIMEGQGGSITAKNAVSGGALFTLRFFK